MRSRLPSTVALQAFEASARLLSFAEAGRECCLTAGAIGRQVRLLEAELGFALFQRKPGGLVLQQAGRHYLEEIKGALHRIEQAGLHAGRQAGDDAGRFSIATPPGFGSRWLMPHYSAFTALHPDTSIQFFTRTHPVDFDEQLFDAAIHFGAEPPSQVQSDLLMAVEEVAVCSSAARHADGMAIGDALQRYRLLHHMDRPLAWEPWLNGLGVSGGPVQRGPAVEQMHLMVEGALSGLGLALLPSFMVQRELAMGA